MWYNTSRYTTVHLATTVYYLNISIDILLTQMLLLWLLTLTYCREVSLTFEESTLGYFRSSQVSLDVDYSLSAKHYPFVDRYYLDLNLEHIARTFYGQEVLGEHWQWVAYEAGSKTPIVINSDTDNPQANWRYALLGYIILNPRHVSTDLMLVELMLFIDDVTGEREEYCCYLDYIEDTPELTFSRSICYARADREFLEPIFRDTTSVSTPARTVTIHLKWPQ
jgi:hypothetical protein